jgi:hypothetical protein
MTAPPLADGLHSVVVLFGSQTVRACQRDRPLCCAAAVHRSLLAAVPLPL